MSLVMSRSVICLRPNIRNTFPLIICRCVSSAPEYKEELGHCWPGRFLHGILQPLSLPESLWLVLVVIVQNTLMRAFFQSGGEVAHWFSWLLEMRCCFYFLWTMDHISSCSPVVISRDFQWGSLCQTALMICAAEMAKHMDGQHFHSVRPETPPARKLCFRRWRVIFFAKHPRPEPCCAGACWSEFSARTLETGSCEGGWTTLCADIMATRLQAKGGPCAPEYFFYKV